MTYNILNNLMLGLSFILILDILYYNIHGRSVIYPISTILTILIVNVPKILYIAIKQEILNSISVFIFKQELRSFKNNYLLFRKDSTNKKKFLKLENNFNFFEDTVESLPYYYCIADNNLTYKTVLFNYYFLTSIIFKREDVLTILIIVFKNEDIENLIKNSILKNRKILTVKNIKYLETVMNDTGLFEVLY